MIAAVLLAAPATAADAGIALPSVFFVAKSENRNQVHYGVRLDASCAPAGGAPVFVYWRMLEHGPGATEPLLSQEEPAYGLADQRVVERSEAGGRVLLRLRALPGRAIALETSGRDGVCRAVATMVIGGGQASLASVYAQLKWPFGVDYLALRGRRLADGRAVEERVTP